MNKLNKFLLTGAAAVVGLAGVAGSALAQDSRETITVVPPFSMQQDQTPLKGGMNTQIISFNRTVSYGDLDLSKPSDRNELAGRIDGAARDACHELDTKFPQTVYVPVPESQDCIGNATRGALAMANISDDEGGVPE
jgi:UrcA family protein